mgnify:CR=1 FL=1
MKNDIVNTYLDAWHKHVADRSDSVKGLLILLNSKMVVDLGVADSHIKSPNGSRLYLEGADEMERDKVGKFAGFSFERIYIIDDGVLSDETLATLRSRLRSPLGIDCKMYINGKD